VDECEHLSDLPPAPEEEYFRREVVLLTGASTGLGLAIAKQLLQTDYRLILTARGSSLQRLSENGFYESERVWLRCLDVTNADERDAVVEEANARWGGVDVLINNAGVSYRAVVEHVAADERMHLLDVNYRAPMEMIRLVLPRMRAKRRGRIISVSSVSGMMAMPTMATYTASKFALEGAHEALWYEVRPWNIHVSLVQPGFIHSTSFENVQYTSLSRQSADSIDLAYHAHYEAMTPFITRMMQHAVATPEKVAKKIVKSAQRRRPPLRVPVTFDAHLFAWIRRWLPRSLYHWILYQCLPRVRTWGPRKIATVETKKARRLLQRTSG